MEDETMANLKLPHAQIVIDEAVLPRMGGADKLVEEYAEIRRLDSNAMPLPVVFFDEAAKKHYLADGDKRIAADKLIGLHETVCEVRKGSRDKAIWFACQANLAHGTRMTATEKRQAVENCLKDRDVREKSDAAIAEQCGVSTSTVQKRRAALNKLLSGGSKAKQEKTLRKTRTGKVMDTSKIGGRGGRKPKAKLPEPEPAVVEPPEVVEDSIKQEVPEWLADVWADVARINGYLTGLTASVVTPVEQLKKSASGAGEGLEPKYVASQLDGIRTHIRDEMPWCCCPECLAAGKRQKSCGVCHGKGWLTHGQYNGAYLT